MRSLRINLHAAIARNRSLDLLFLPFAVVGLSVAVYRLLDPPAPPPRVALSSTVAVTAPQGVTTGLNIWAAQGPDCKPPAGTTFTAKASGTGTASLSQVPITITTTAHPNCIGKASEATEASYIPQPGYLGDDQVTVDMQEAGSGDIVRSTFNITVTPAPPPRLTLLPATAVTAPQGVTTGLNIWAAQGPDCRPPVGTTFTAKASGTGTATLSRVPITITATTHPDCIGKASEATKASYTPQPGYLGDDQVTVDMQEAGSRDLARSTFNITVTPAPPPRLTLLPATAVTAPQGVTTGLNVWAPQGPDCRPPVGTTFTAKASGTGTATLSRVPITITATTHPDCIGKASEATKASYTPQPGYLGEDQVTVDMQEAGSGDIVRFTFDVSVRPN